MAPRFLPTLVGQRFGRLLVISMHSTSQRGAYFLCRCDCGNERVVKRGSLVGGYTKSCGCLQKDAAVRTGHQNRTHGLTKTPTYAVWKTMVGRCERPSTPSYKDYGGRGITVCKRWHKFENFYADMGEAPSGLSIERIDGHRGYEPGNCRWATHAEQARNRRSNRNVAICGTQMCLMDACAKFGLDYNSMRMRVHRHKHHYSHVELFYNALSEKMEGMA